MNIDKTSVLVYVKLHIEFEFMRLYIKHKKDLAPFYRETKISLIQGIVLLKLSNYFYSVTIL